MDGNDDLWEFLEIKPCPWQRDFMDLINSYEAKIMRDAFYIPPSVVVIHRRGDQRLSPAGYRVLLKTWLNKWKQWVK